MKICSREIHTGSNQSKIHLKSPSCLWDYNYGVKTECNRSDFEQSGHTGT
jgi:hypothetical protein